MPQGQGPDHIISNVGAVSPTVTPDIVPRADGNADEVFEEEDFITPVEPIYVDGAVSHPLHNNNSAVTEFRLGNHTF